MYMLKHAMILRWALLTLASPLQIPFTAPSKEPLGLSTRANPFACPANKLHNPTVTEWNWALNTYCSHHTPARIASDSPLVFTYQLTAFDKKPIKWVFKVWIDDEMREVRGGVGKPTKYSFELDKELCKRKFMDMVTEGKGGGMPKVVCEVGKEKLFRGGVIGIGWLRSVMGRRFGSRGSLRGISKFFCSFFVG